MKLLRRSWPWWVVLGVVLAGLALWGLQRAREVEVVAVTRGPVVQSIVATGRVDTPARITISSQSAARIEEVLAREGDRVSAGQPLVRLRSDEAQAALEAARAALREAEGRQRQLERVQRPVAEQQLAQARANLEAARRELAAGAGKQFDPKVVDVFCGMDLAVWEKIRYATTRLLPPI